jgi:hypothetical protein
VGRRVGPASGLRDDVARRLGIQPAGNAGRHVGGAAAYRWGSVALLRTYRPGNGTDALSGDGLTECDVIERMHLGGSLG